MSIDFTGIKDITIPEGEVKKIMYGDTVIWERTVTNLLPLSTDTDRTTIYNGCGYKSGYRLSSSSGGLSSMTGMCTSGFIPCEVGDVLRIYGITHKSGTQSYVMGFNSSNVKTGAINWNNTTNGVSSIYEVTLTESNLGSGFDSIRICCGTMDENTIITLNEEFDI